MWCWWRCIPESVCRLPVHVPASHRFPPSLLCSPAVAESNCTFFKFFTTGENAVMFQKTTQKSESEHPPPLLSWLSHLTRPLLYLLLCPSLPPASPSPPLSPFLCPLPAVVSHGLLAALSQAAHCLIRECLRSLLPTLCSRVSKPPSNISFDRRICDKISRRHERANAEVHLWKPHHLLLPHGKKRDDLIGYHCWN